MPSRKRKVRKKKSKLTKSLETAKSAVSCALLAHKGKEGTRTATASFTNTSNRTGVAQRHRVATTFFRDVTTVATTTTTTTTTRTIAKSDEPQNIKNKSSAPTDAPVRICVILIVLQRVDILNGSVHAHTRGVFAFIWRREVC